MSPDSGRGLDLDASPPVWLPLIAGCRHRLFRLPGKGPDPNVAENDGWTRPH